MRILFRGRVQGVGFRPAVVRAASRLGLSGYVANLGSEVEVVVPGDPAHFVEALRAELPPLAVIDDVAFEPGEPDCQGFVIRASGTGARGSELPPDAAICPACLADIRAENGRRWGHPFTACTDCGPRHSIASSLPFDRERTSMASFPLCSECAREYADPSDRRFHAQTMSCPVCGPRYAMYDANGAPAGGVDEFARLIDGGGIGVLKGWGGMHLVCDARRVRRFREWYGRARKPLAVMFRDATAIRACLDASEADIAAMTSKEAPIFLLRKRPDAPEWVEWLSPGLCTVGAMLPYAGIHHLLFDRMACDAVILTSANIQGEPMLVDDADAFSLKAGGFLLHDMRIAARSDDSVVKPLHHGRVLLRRSRGFVPGLVAIPGARGALALGGEENLTSAVGLGGRIAVSQHIGDADGVGVAEFAREAAERLASLYLGEGPRVILHDLHPQYRTTRLAEEMAMEMELESASIQHHHAHAAALLAESGLDSMAVLALDGSGFGSDGVLWGGEVLLVDTDGGCERIGHLREFPLLGGEAAVREPMRLALALADTAGGDAGSLGVEGAEVLLRAKGMFPKTTSFGRMLDAFAALGGVCRERTYRGEPAMALERCLERGDAAKPMEVPSDGAVIDQAAAFESAMSAVADGAAFDDASASAVKGVLDALIEIAVGQSREVGLSGGVAYSAPIARWFQSGVEAKGGRARFHSILPPGDGGVSAGQVIAYTYRRGR